MRKRQVIITNKESWVQRWKFDKERIKEAIETLNIKGPISIRLDYKFGIGGEYEFYRNRHRVWVNLYEYFDFANKVLWHELCHVVQCEKYPTPTDYFKQYDLAGGNIYCAGYDDNVFEIEAQNFAEEWCGNLLLKKEK